MTDPHKLTAGQASAALQSGRLTSEALIRSCLARIAARDADVEAWAYLDEGQALAAARASDVKRAAGTPLGPLAGIPVGVKDIIDTADMPTELGTPVFAGRRPDKDASVVAQLRAAGAIILGKTVTTELAFFGPGKTKNPHNPARTPGGSSSGSAAAVADFQVPLALGTQTAGSIIRPASYCGTIGFKPTFGAVSRTGVLPQSGPLDTIGGYAREVADIALMMDAISAYDSADLDMADSPRPSLGSEVAQPLGKSPRLAFIKTPAWPQADDATRAAFEALPQRLAGTCAVIETPLPADFDTSLRLQQIVQFSDIARNYGPIADANPQRVTAKLKDIIAEGRSFSASEIAHARAEAARLYGLMQTVVTGFDAVLTPAAPGIALAGLGATGSPMFNALWTYLGMPCLSLPLLDVRGLPLGVQLCALRGEDGALLRAGHALMAALPKS